MKKKKTFPNKSQEIVDQIFALQKSILEANRPSAPYQAGQVLQPEDMNKIGESIEAILVILQHIFETQSDVVAYFQGNKIFQGFIRVLGSLYARQLVVGSELDITEETPALGAIHNQQSTNSLSQGIRSFYHNNSVTVGHHRLSATDFSGLAYNSENLIGRRSNGTVEIGNNNRSTHIKGNNIYLSPSSKTYCQGDLEVSGNISAHNFAGGATHKHVTVGLEWFWKMDIEIRDGLVKTFRHYKS